MGIILYYRGISLLNIPGKVFAGILNVRLLTDNRLLEEQVGFRSGRGCVDHLCDKAVGGKAFGEKEEGVCRVGAEIATMNRVGNTLLDHEATTTLSMRKDTRELTHMSKAPCITAYSKTNTTL